VRRQVVAEYEEVARAGGVLPERVDLGPLAATAALVRRPPSGAAVVLLLGDAAIALLGFDRGRLLAFRTRFRGSSAGEPERLLADASRSARSLGGNGAPRLLVTGTGASRFVGDLLAAGGVAEPAAVAPGLGPLAEAAELAFAGAAFP
jgi:hypothetical protein